MLTESNKEFLKRVEKYAKKPGMEFVWVYRGEGLHQEDLLRGVNSNLKGSWYTEYFDKAVEFKELAIENGSKEGRILAVAITKDMLESRDVMQRGMGEINVMVENIQPRVVEEEIKEVPTEEEYLNQFKGYSEYKSEIEGSSESNIS